VRVEHRVATDHMTVHLNEALIAPRSCSYEAELEASAGLPFNPDSDFPGVCWLSAAVRAAKSHQAQPGAVGICGQEDQEEIVAGTLRQFAAAHAKLDKLDR
jgi:hypothetical protein